MKISKFAFLIVGSMLLSGCGGTPTLSSNNLVCAFVEGYLETKALALVSLAQGGSASSWIDGDVGAISTEIPEGTEARQVFDDFLIAMSVWGNRVDSANTTGNSAEITAAAIELEAKMDPIAAECERLGWKFLKDWR
jgi:hypothetical protein